MKFRKLIKFAWIFILLSIGACASPAVPVLFAADKAGSVASQSICVDEEAVWTAYLDFNSSKKDEKSFSHLFDIADGISGGGGSISRPHRGIRLLVSVEKRKNGQPSLVKKEIVTVERTHSRLDLYIDYFRLSRGKYIVSVQTLDDDPRLSGIDVGLVVGMNWK